MADDPNLKGLYPFLHGKKQDPVAMNSALIESVRQKAANHHDVVDALPLPNYEGSEQVHELMSRVPALAVENSTFAIRIRRFLHDVTPEFEGLIGQVVQRLPENERFDPRIITVFVMNQNWIFNDLRGPHRISNEEYRQFLLQLMADSQYRH